VPAPLEPVSGASSYRRISPRRRRVRDANAEFLDERLPNSRLALIDAGHFVWEEAPREYADAALVSILGSDDG